ncbi:MAG: tetratricopeptide repeat protein [Candidatus Omnitrophica bacterium]|nr:tetratricopeptide repeat protein [Candidatus Omnitrophota bacterium]
MLTKKQIYLLLIALCFLVYANSLNNEFVSDDIPAIVENSYISHPARYWLSPPMFLNSLCYLAVQDNPFLHHLVSITLHAIVTILVYFFLGLFFKGQGSLLGACLFAVHPIHSEAVTWVSGRLYIILALFILTTFFLYYQATLKIESGRRINLKKYLIAIIIFSYYIIHNLSFYFVFPLFLILFDLTFGRWRKAWRWWLPFLVIVILRIIFARGMIVERISYVAGEMGGPVTWNNPIFNLVYSLFSHLGLLIWPAQLTLYHEPHVISAFMLKVGIFSLVILLFSLFFIFKKSKEIFLGMGIFVLFLAPTYSPMTVSWLLAERYLYFPSIFLSIILVFFYERFLWKSERWRRLGLAFFILIIVAYAVRTVDRNADWKTRERFWRKTTVVSDKSPRAYNNMGDVYSQEANPEGAIRAFKKAIELKPDYADAYHNLAITYQQAGNIQEAIRCYQQAVRFKPDLFESHINLGVVYLNQGNYDLAIGHLKRAVEIRPDDANTRKALNFAIQKQKR